MDRTQRVAIWSVHSDDIKLRFGVPQGSGAKIINSVLSWLSLSNWHSSNQQCPTNIFLNVQKDRTSLLAVLWLDKLAYHYHSTETALLRVHQDIAYALDSNCCAVLLMLDLSATFLWLDKLAYHLHTNDMTFHGTCKFHRLVLRKYNTVLVLKLSPVVHQNGVWYHPIVLILARRLVRSFWTFRKMFVGHCWLDDCQYA
jgi:hypothetical protein